MSNKNFVLFHDRVRSVARPHTGIALLLAVASACGGSEPLRSCAPPDVALAGDIESAVASLSCVESINVDPTGLPTFVTGELGRGAGSDTLSDVDASLKNALDLIAPVFRLQRDDLVALSVDTDTAGVTHVRYAQTKDGLDVLGGNLTVHITNTGIVNAVSGHARGGFNLPTIPRRDRDVALHVVRTETPGTTLSLGEPQLVYIVSSLDGAVYLAWEVAVSGFHPDGTPMDLLAYVDSQTGTMVNVATQIHPVLDRNIYDANGGTNLPGTLIMKEGDMPPVDADVTAAYNNMGKTHQCFIELFAMDSYDGLYPDDGSSLKISVHYGASASDKNNAFWSSTKQQFSFGDGDGVNYSGLARAFDVNVHEFTHAVTEHSAKLAYNNESGALNEGMSDIFAAACEEWADGGISADTWKLGEDAKTPNVPGDALRYMANPTQDGWSKDYYPERNRTPNTRAGDWGGVHTNSGIANLAFKLLVTGGKHPRAKTTVEVPALGMEKAINIFHVALTIFLTETSNFSDARAATVAAAKFYYGQTEADATAKAWEAVGVGSALLLPTAVVGKVLDASALASPDATVTIKLADEPSFARTAVTTAAGTFRFDGIPSDQGAITVTASCLGDNRTSSSGAIDPAAGSDVDAGMLTTPTQCGCGDSGPGWVACPLSGQCMHDSWFCDGMADCPGGEDEVNDANGNPCP